MIQQINIQRFKKVLTDEEIKKNIMPDLQKHKIKVNHWMWWGFPQHVVEKYINKVSYNTKLYSIHEKEVIPFIQFFYNYYKKALSTIKRRLENNTLNLETFFSSVDYKKFINHITLFEKICSENKEDPLIYEIYRLLEYIKLHLSIKHKKYMSTTDDTDNLNRIKDFILNNINRRFPHTPSDYILKIIQHNNGNKTEKYMLKLWYDFRNNPELFLITINNNDKKVVYRKLVKLFLKYAAYYSNIKSIGSFLRKVVAKLTIVPYKYIGQYFTDQTEGLQQENILEIKSKIKHFNNSKRRYIIWLAIQTMFKTAELQNVRLQMETTDCKMDINAELFEENITMINKINKLSYKCLKNIYNRLVNMLTK